MKNKLLLLAMSFLTPGYLIAQPFNVSITSGPVGACTKTTYNVVITGFTSTSDVDISIENNIIVSGSELTSYPCLYGGGTNGEFPVYSQINTMIPATGCLVINPLYNPNIFTFTLTSLSIGGTATFSYDVYIDCSAIPGSTATNIDFNQEWSAEVNTVPQTVIIAFPGILNVYEDEAINYPFLDHLSTVTEDTYYGAVTYLYFEYVNQGTDGNIAFSFENNVSTCASVYNILETKYDVNGTLYPFNVLASNPLAIVHNDVIRIRQKIQITGCLPCSEPSAVFKWKCDYSAGIYGFCTECQEIYTTTVNVIDTAGLTYGLTMNRMQPANNLPLLYGNYGFWDVTCDNNGTHWKISIKNTGNVTLPVARFSLAHSNWADFVFTSIDPTSIVYNYYDETYSLCTPCSFSQVNPVITTVAGNPFYCAPSPVSLAGLDLNISELGPQHSVELEFDAFRCCSDDEALLNHSIGYNQYTAGLRYSIACDDDFSTLDFGGSNDVSSPVTPTWDSYGITSNRYNELNGEFDLQLGFTPTITDLSVMPGQTFGEDANFSINLNGLFPGPFDQQVLGVQSVLNSTTPVNAILRARIHCDKGLRIESLVNDVKLKSNLGTSLELTPVCYYKETNVNNCVEDFYYYYYQISTGQDIFNYINSGRLDFRVISCCVADQPATYEVAFHILRDPNDCGLSFACQDTVTAPVCNDCCWIPLSSEGNYINVHCPGCKAPGIIVDSYDLKRTSLGWIDSDNDRIANNPLDPLTTSSAEYPNLNLSFSYHGDELEDCMVAHFQEGAPGDGGYSYVQIITPPDGDPSNELKYLQLQRTFSKKDLMAVVLTGFDFYIEEISGNSSGCVNCTSCGLGNNFYNTTFEMHLSSADPEFGYFYPDPSLSNEFFFSFSRADIENYQLLHGGSFNNGFQENQRYRLVCRYKVCGNHTNLTLEQCDISNRMWLSNTLKPHDAFTNPMYAQMPNLLPTAIPPFPASWADPYIFYCETFGGIHYFSGLATVYYIPFLGLHWDGLPYYYGVQGSYTCLPHLRFVTSVASTVDYFTFYPYEIRIPTIEPYEWVVAPPPGYIITNGRVYSDFNYYNVGGTPTYNGCYSSLTTNNFSPGLFPIVSSTTITLADLPSINCVSDLTQACSPVSTLSIGDLNQKFVFEFDLAIDPSSCTPGLAYSDWASLTNAKFRDRTSLCGISNSTSACTSFAQTLYCANPDGQSLVMPDPNLTIDFLPEDIDVNTHQICWEFQVSNLTPGTTAYTVFLGVPATNPLYYYLTNWQLVYDGGTILIDPSTGYFNLGNVSPGTTSIYGTLCVDYDECMGGGSFPVYWGWNCNGVPDDMPPASSTCLSANSVLTFDDVEIIINPTGLYYPPTYSPCSLIENIYGEFTCYSSLPGGETYPEEIQFTTVTGLSVYSVTLVNCSTSTSTPLTYSGGWFITPGDLTIIFGHPYLGVGECLQVLVTYEPTCEYNGALPDIILLSEDYCHEQMPPSTAQFTPSWSITNSECCFSCEGFSMNYIQKEDCEFSFNAIIPPGLPCSSASTVEWDFGDGGIATGTSVSHQYLINDTYTVCYLYTCYDGETPTKYTCEICTTIVVACLSDTFCLKIPKENDADIGNGIMETTDGGFTLAATLYETGSGGDHDMYFLKYSSIMTQEYYYRIGDYNPFIYGEDGNSVLVRPDGYYIAGTIYKNSEDEDVFVAKIRLDGSLEYSYRYSASLPRKEGAYKIIDMSSSTEEALLVVGYAEISDGDKNVLALKLNPADLSIMAQNTYHAVTNLKSQEIGYDAVKTGIHTMTDHYAIVGEQFSDTTNKNVIVINIKTDLSLLSNSKIYSSNNRSEVGKAIAAYSDVTGASLYITGTSSTIGGRNHILVMKLSAIDLSHQSNVIYEQTSTTIEEGQEIIVDNDGNLVIVGINDTDIPTSGPDALILKLRSTNKLGSIWCKSTNLQPFSERFRDVSTYGNNYYLATGSYPNSSGGDEDIFVAKIEKDSGYSCCLFPYPIHAKSVVYSIRAVDEREPKLKETAYGDSIPYPGDELICPGGHGGSGKTLSQNIVKGSNGIIKIYPNPAVDEFVVDFMGQQFESYFDFKISDVTGRQIKNFTAAQDKNSKIYIDARNFPAGIYFIEISSSNDNWKSKILINR